MAEWLKAPVLRSVSTRPARNCLTLVVPISLYFSGTQPGAPRKPSFFRVAIWVASFPLRESSGALQPGTRVQFEMGIHHKTARPQAKRVRVLL